MNALTQHIPDYRATPLPEGQPPIFDLFIKPTYAVLLPQRAKQTTPKTEAQIKAQLNLKENKVKGELSATSVKKLKNAVNWLTAAAPTKTIYHKATNTRYKFKLNFITLTLPGLEHGISDHHFKTKLLHNFINTARYKFGMKSYIWKVETQANGNIHAHFTTDTFIHYSDLRLCWNRILQKHGAMDCYTKKHQNLTFAEYNKLYNNDGKKPTSKMQQAYQDGCNTQWKNPNSTDVKAVHKIQDIAAYLAKYMSKKEEGRRQINGRLWGCSYNISAANNLTIEIVGDKNRGALDQLFKKEIAWKPIEFKDKLSGKMRQIGEMFFYTLKDWGNAIKGELLEAFNEHIFFIRNDIDVLGLRSYGIDIQNEIIEAKNQLYEQPVNIENYGDFLPPSAQLECPF